MTSFLNSRTVAAILGVCHDHANWLIRSGRIRGRKVCGAWAVAPRDLGEYLEDRLA